MRRLSVKSSDTAIVSLRDAFGRALVALGEVNPDLVVVDADNHLATRTTAFAQRFPDRFVNVGCSEQNMIGIAAGFALSGSRVLASTFASFLVGRAFDQIRLAICQNHLPVILVGTHAGISVGQDGPSHFSVEDIALMRSLPGMSVAVASSADQLDELLHTAVTSRTPFYIRVSRHSTTTCHSDAINQGGAAIHRVGNQVSIFTCGVALERVLAATERLEALGIGAEVIDVYIVKPLPINAILQSARRTRCVVVVEEHNSFGGLGEGIMRELGLHFPCRCAHVSVHETFAASGRPDDVLNSFGLSIDDIVGAVQRVVGST